MVDEGLYITPHEAALAVVATAMKKARLRLDTLVINSIVGGVLFSAGGMLHLCAQAENPALFESNPGIVRYMQGMVYPIGLFYVIVMGAELFNSNILYFSVGVCRGAVSIFDLLISWSISWLFNLGGNLFVCYVICHLSDITQSPLYREGAIAIAVDKCSVPFIKTFIRGIAGNFCVCLAVYLQLLAKPYHVKFILMFFPIFTFVSMGFNHVVADMYLIPMGLIEGAPVSVGTYIWKTSISATLGNAVGGSIFGAVVPYYLHLVVVERDRELLNLPKFEARDEQPELEMDSRVVRVPTNIALNQSAGSSSDSDNEKSNSQMDPIEYRPASQGVDIHPTFSSTSRRSNRDSESLRSPPGVFPVMGMGEPLTRERTIAGGGRRSSNDDQSILSAVENSSALSRTFSMSSNSRNLRDVQRYEEDGYARDGGYNARENALGESLKRVITRSSKGERKSTVDTELGLRRPSNSSILDSPSGIFRSISRTFSQKNPGSATELNDRLHRYSITRAAADASDNIADFNNDIRPPQPARRNPSYASARSTVKLSPIQSDHGGSSTDIDQRDETETQDPENFIDQISTLSRESEKSQ